MKKRIVVFFIVIGFLALFLKTNTSFAQGDFGIEEVGVGIDNSLASGEDVRIVAGRFIQFALGFLGVLAVLLIMYAGFVWMTSGGDEEKIRKAKGILKSSVIGLIIVLSSWGLTTFILSRVKGLLGPGQGSQGYNQDRPSFGDSGSSAIGACSVESIYPSDGQKDVPRNTSILITFMEAADLSNACVDSMGATCSCDNASCSTINPKIFRLFKKSLLDACSSSSCPDINSNVTDVKLTFTSDKKTLILAPANYLGSGTEHIPYTFKVDGNLKKENGADMFQGCNVNKLEVSFEVSNILDLSPPIVNRNGIFPLPDNERDLLDLSVPAQKASALIEVGSCPQAYSAAELLSINSANTTETNLPEVKINYKGASKYFIVTVPDDKSKAQLFEVDSSGANSKSLGIADWNLENEVVFPGYFSLKYENPSPGNRWEIEIKPEALADTLRLNDQEYVFSDNNNNNNIKVIPNCSASSQDLALQAENIQAVISGNAEVESDLDSNKINLRAKVPGLKGNKITLEAKSEALKLKAFSGGVDRVVVSTANDKTDRPRNSAIQFTFNESVNPITVSGSSDEVADYVRVLNYNKEALKANSNCSKNSDCLSYKCENSVCLGNQLSGRFMISNNYRTVEFLTDEECGLNACGDKIYCLPANSHLRVEVSAANLSSCSSAADCSSLSPFTACMDSDLGYKTCQNPDRKNYPMANVNKIDGVVDVAINSFDGNRSEFSSGPLGFFHENTPASVDLKDGYSWSFFVSDEINLSPPQISKVTPMQGDKDVSLATPIKIHFNKLMLNSTLTSGSVNIFNGEKNIKHKLISLKSSTPSPLGFWVYSENIDSEPFNGEPDLTIATIKHSPFLESLSFSAQVGSGVKDIYQNCYKPSVGPGCPSTEASCCFGESSSTLDEEGNCRF